MPKVQSRFNAHVWRGEFGTEDPPSLNSSYGEAGDDEDEHDYGTLDIPPSYAYTYVLLTCFKAWLFFDNLQNGLME
jgi:hypothetical protein